MTKQNTQNISSTLAKSDDGGVQINFTIPWPQITDQKTKVLTEIGAETEVPGFRKGKAPFDQVEAKASPQTVIEKTLQAILPKALAEAIGQYKLKLAIYPRFETVKIKDGEDWQIKAHTCEIPEFELGDYKKEVAGALRAKAIWTPDKGADKPKEPTREEKEYAVIKALLTKIIINLPQMLITEEVNHRLSGLLERIEKLGLNLDGYLNSIGKTAQELRSEYETQAKEAITVELILEKIAAVEKIVISEAQINEAIKAAGIADSTITEKLNSPEQKMAIASILRRRASLDTLTSLV